MSEIPPSSVPPTSGPPPPGETTKAVPAEALTYPVPPAAVTAAAATPKRPMPAWVIAIPLMALAGAGGYFLAQSGNNSGNSASGTAAGGPPGMSTGAGSNSAGNTGMAGSGTSGTGRRHRRRSEDGSSTGAANGTNTAGTGSNWRSRAGQAGAGAAAGGASAASNANPTNSASSTTSAGAATIAVTAKAVHQGTLTAQRSATATVSAQNSTTVSTRNSGTISSLNAAVGQTVSPNQVLATLSNPDLQASVQSAQNALQSAQAQLASQQATLLTAQAQLQAAVNSAQLSLQNAQQIYDADQKLYAAGAIARTELNTQAVAVQNARSSLAAAQTNLNQNKVSQQSGIRDLQLAVDKARIALNQARQQATQVQVLAPYAGKVTAVTAAAGQYVTSGTALLSLVSSGQQLSFNVPPSETGNFPLGRELSFKAGQKQYKVKVSSNPESASSGVVAINARFLEEAPVTGTVGAVSYSSKVGTGILVPTTALQVDTDKTSVFVVDGGKATLKQVTVIGQTGDTAVVSGISDGAQVISAPPAGLISGSKVDTSGASSGGAPMGGPGGPP